MNCVRQRIFTNLGSISIVRGLDTVRVTSQKAILPRYGGLSASFTTTRRTRQQSSQRPTGNPVDDDPAWVSVVDREPVIVKVKQGHGPGIILLAFALGTWQVQRLTRKTDMIARYEDQLIRPPLPLPPRIDESTVPEFDFRRVYATGRLRHDQEILVGPRIHDGEDGFLVFTPLERDGASKIIVSRGWIPKAKKAQKDRDPEALPSGLVSVQGLMREPPKKNSFTPDNQPDKGEFYFPDIAQFAQITGSQAVFIEETMDLELFEILRREQKGIPIGRQPSVNLANNHAQYIFTWYSLAAATSIMFLMLLKKKPQGASRTVRKSSEW